MDELMMKKSFFKGKINEKMDYFQFEMILTTLISEKIAIPVDDSGEITTCEYNERKIIPIYTEGEDRAFEVKWKACYLRDWFEKLVDMGKPIVLNPSSDTEYELTAAWLASLEHQMVYFSKVDVGKTHTPGKGFADYTLDYFRKCEKEDTGEIHKKFDFWHDKSCRKYRLTVELEASRYWFLSVFLYENGSFDKYCLDYEAASDSHYEFRIDLDKAAELFEWKPKDDRKVYLHDILIDFLARGHKGYEIEHLLDPYIFARFHY